MNACIVLLMHTCNFNAAPQTMMVLASLGLFASFLFSGRCQPCLWLTITSLRYASWHPTYEIEFSYYSWSNASNWKLNCTNRNANVTPCSRPLIVQGQCAVIVQQYYNWAIHSEFHYPPATMNSISNCKLSLHELHLIKFIRWSANRESWKFSFQKCHWLLWRVLL